MSEGAVLELIVLASTAGGLVLFGASRLLLSARSLTVQFSAALLACVLPAIGPLAVGFSTAALAPVAMVGVAELLTALAGSTRSSQTVITGLNRFRQPGLQAGTLSAIGGILLIVALARFDESEVAALDRDDAVLMEATWRPPLAEVEGVPASTDRGHRIALWNAAVRRSPQEVVSAEFRALNGSGYFDRLIRTGPADEMTNCHGWVFTGGRYWLSPDDVEQILTDNCYLPTSMPRPGDLAIYRASGKIHHSAVVRTTLDDGTILVESKWGWMGVYIHRVNDSFYGQELTFYHSPRTGHLLPGLAEPTAPISNHLITQKR